MRTSSMAAARLPPAPLRVLVHAMVYGAAALMALPFLWMLSTSLKSDEEALRAAVTLLPESWAWENYARAVREAELHLFYFNSIVVAVANTVFGVLHNALAGFAFAKLRFTGSRAMFWMALLTMMLPIQVFFIFAYVIASRLGYVDNLPALFVPFLASGFGIFYMRQAIASVPDSLLDAGRVDGMTTFEVFWHVVVPAVWPAITALAIFTFVFSWNNFFWPLIVIDSSDHNTLPLAVAGMAAGEYIRSWPVQMAALSVLTIPLVIVFLVFQRAFVRGIVLTGLKE